MTFPNVASVTPTSFGTAATSHAVAMPATVNAGDRLVIIFSNDNNDIPTFPTPAWSAVSQVARTSNNTNTLSILERIADGSEGGTTVNVVTAAIQQAVALVYRITGAHPSTASEAGTAATALDANPNPPNLTPSWGAEDTLWLACYSADQSSRNATAYPTNYNDNQNTAQSNPATGNGSSVGAATRELNATSDNPGTFTIATSDGWVAQTVAIRTYSPPSATGTDTLSQLTASGSASQEISASGTPSLPQLSAAGDALYVTPITASGDDSLSQLTAQVTGYKDFGATGAPTLPPIVATGDSVSGLIAATGTPTLQQLLAFGQSTPSDPLVIDDTPAIFEWILPTATAVYPHTFTAPVQTWEWVLPQASYPIYKRISILHLPSYGVFIHSPWFPYKRIRDITHLVSNIDRNYSRMDVGNLSFTIPKLPADDHSIHQGNIAVVQTEDQPVWAGPIYILEDSLGTGTTQVRAYDMASLLARRMTDIGEHYTTAIGSGAVIRSMINKMNARGATGIIIGQIDPGPVLYDLELGGQSVLDGLNQIHDRTDWEWWIENEATPHKLVSRFFYGRRQGVDLSRTIHLWYGHHFKEGTLTHDLSEGKQVSIVVGGGFKKIWNRNYALASSITGPKISNQSLLNQLTPELNVRTNNQLPAALRDERQRVDVMTENSSELIRSSERDAIRKLYAETTLQVVLNNFDRAPLLVGNYISIHAPLGHHGELDGPVRLVEVQPDDELGETICTMEVRL